MRFRLSAMCLGHRAELHQHASCSCPTWHFGIVLRLLLDSSFAYNIGLVTIEVLAVGREDNTRSPPHVATTHPACGAGRPVSCCLPCCLHSPRVLVLVFSCVAIPTSACHLASSHHPVPSWPPRCLSCSITRCICRICAMILFLTAKKACISH